MISAVKPNMLELVWPIVSRMIEVAIEHSNDELDLEDMKRRILAEELLLVTIDDDGLIVAAFTVERKEFSSGKTVMHISTMGGEKMDNWFDYVADVLDKLAVEQGCDEIYIVGRPAWKRLLKPKGYEVIHTVLSKKLGD